MYKVFVNDKPIILSDLAVSHSEYEIYLLKNTRFEEVIHKLQNSNLAGIYLYHNDLETLWDRFTNHFKMVIAAGGLVVNAQNELLFIRRNEHWDLPKGHVEIEETCSIAALREVTEECAVSALKIVEELTISYHIYYENGSFKLKKTHWFLMNTNSNEKPIPQKEEGITMAKYISLENLQEYYPEMYGNIKDIVREYNDKKGK